MTYVELSAWLVLHIPNRKNDNETDNEESPDEDSKLKQKVEHHRADNKKRLKLLLKQTLT